MADPLSIITSVVSIAGAAIAGYQALNEMVEGIRNAPEEITSLLRDSHSFYTIVFSLQSALTRKDITDTVVNDPDIMAAVRNLGEPLGNCSFILGQLLVKIQAHRKPNKIDGGFRINTVDLAWYFTTRNEVKGLTDRLERAKATLDAALGAITLCCNFRLMKANDQSDRNIRRGTTDTDAGFALRRYFEETSSCVHPDSPSSLRLSAEFDSHLWLGESPAMMPFEPRPDRKVPTPEPLDQKDKLPAQVPVDFSERLRKADEQRNALHKAAQKGDNLIVQQLLAEGADVNAKAPDGKTALNFTAEHGYESVARVLLENKANVNAKTGSQGFPEVRKFKGGRTPLHWAAAKGYEDVIEVLLDNGADIKAVNTSRRGVLQEALRSRSDGAAKLLIARGAPIDHRDDEGWQPLHQAANKGRLEIIKLLVAKGAELDALTGDSNIWGNQSFIHTTPSLLAAVAGHTASMQYLLSRGADMYHEHGAGEGAIHAASHLGHFEQVRTLLDAGIEIETRDSRWDETPLLKAASTGRANIVLLLLKRGADPHATTLMGRDVLKHCMLHQQGNEEAVLAIKDWLAKFEKNGGDDKKREEKR